MVVGEKTWRLPIRLWRRHEETKEEHIMDLREERLKILHMVADGTITPEDAARLLEALGNGGEQASQTVEAPQDTDRQPKWFKIRVTDTDTGRVRVNVTLPMALFRGALKLGGRINVVGDRISQELLDGLEEALATGKVGKLIDVVDEEDGERVEIYVE